MNEKATHELIEQRPLTEAYEAANVIDDRIVKLASPQRRGKLDRPRRIVTIECKPNKKHWIDESGCCLRDAEGLMLRQTNGVAALKASRAACSENRTCSPNPTPLTRLSR